MAHDPDPTKSETKRTIDLLRAELMVAQQRRDQCFRRYVQALDRRNATRSGDVMDFQKAYYEYNKSQQGVLDAMMRVNTYLLRKRTAAVPEPKTRRKEA